MAAWLGGLSTMKYFAYGSNMLTERLSDRVSSAKNPRRHALHEYRLRFHKKSGDGSGKCNIVRTGSDHDVAHGVLFDIDDRQISDLDTCEGCGQHYRKCWITDQIDGEETEIFFYVSMDGMIDDSLKPYCWYHKLVLYGAEQHGLPDDYIAWLRTIPCMRDPNPDRGALDALEKYEESKNSP